MDQVAIVLLTMLSTIAMLVVISLGLAVIFGSMGIINLAHGEFLMLGAFAQITLVNEVGLSFWVGLLIAPVIVGAIGLLVERGVIRFLYGRPLDAILATFGLSLVIVQVVVNVFGTSTRGIRAPLGSIAIGEFSISGYRMAMVLFAVALVAITYLVFTRTRYGVMARAASQVPEMARAVGVNASRINMLTFAFGAALAGVGGAMMAALAAVVPTMGAGFIAQSFMTVVVAGPLPVTGTFAAASVLGASNSLVAYYSTVFLGQTALLVVAILVLRLMPEGLSGRWRIGL